MLACCHDRVVGDDLVEAVEHVAEDAAVAVAIRRPRRARRPPLPQHDHPRDLGVGVRTDPGDRVRANFDLTFMLPGAFKSLSSCIT